MHFSGSVFLAVVFVCSAVAACTQGPSCEPFAAGREQRPSCGDMEGARE